MELKQNEIEKIEIAKNKGNYFFTGKLTDLRDGWVLLNTTRGENLKFRKDQVMQRVSLSCQEDVRNETKNTKNLHV